MRLVAVYRAFLCVLFVLDVCKDVLQRRPSFVFVYRSCSFVVRRLCSFILWCFKGVHLQIDWQLLSQSNNTSICEWNTATRGALCSPHRCAAVCPTR
jgi:hypothetical protein